MSSSVQTGLVGPKIGSDECLIHGVRARPSISQGPKGDVRFDRNRP